MGQTFLYPSSAAFTLGIYLYRVACPCGERYSHNASGTTFHQLQWRTPRAASGRLWPPLLITDLSVPTHIRARAGAASGLHTELPPLSLYPSTA